MPWDQNTLLGWMADALFSLPAVIAYCLTVPPLLTLFVSICKYHDAFYKMFCHQVAEIDALTNRQPLPTIRIKEIIRDSILFHISAKE